MSDRTCQPVRSGASPASMPGRLLPSLPLVVWMLVASLAIGLAGAMTPAGVIGAFNEGFGRAIGEFALILLPSFTIAAALSHAGTMPPGAGRVAALASPAAGAGMICPDTAYAALSPASSGRKLQVAFGAYTGFKLLFPAGPLIVATGLGVDGSGLLLAGIALAVPVWAAGVTWARFAGGAEAAGTSAAASGATASSPREVLAAYGVFLPFAVLALLLGVAPVVGMTGNGALDLLLQPKGALIAAAVVALLQTPAGARRACLDSAVHRTGALLLVIGAASASAPSWAASCRSTGSCHRAVAWPPSSACSR